MSYDGSLTFDTSIDTSGFNAGVSKISSLASTGLKATVAVITAASAGIVAFGTASIKAGSEFDSAMSQLAATMGTTTDQIDDLRETAIEMGESTAFSATEAAEGLNILAQAGYDATAQMDMIGSVLNLAAAGATTMDNAASYLTTTLKGYCIDAKESGEMSEYYANLIAKGASLVNTNVDELGTAMADSAASAHNYGQEVETTTTALLALADGGKTGSEAATALNRLMTDLYAPTSAASEALDELGVSCYTESGEARDLMDVIEDLQDATAGMVDEEKNAIMNTILTTQGMNAYSAITIKTADDIDTLTANLLDCEGAAAAMADTQMDNLEGDITKLQSALGTLEVRINDNVSPSLRDFAQMGTEQIGILAAAVGEGGLQGGIEACGDVLANLLTYVGELAPSIIETGTNLIHNFCEGLQDTALTSSTASSLIGDLVSAFLSCAGDIWSTALVLVTQLAQGLADGVPDIMDAGISMVGELVSAIGDNGPKLAEAAVNIINSLTDYLAENFPQMVSSGLETLISFSQGLRENVGYIVDAALELITTLAQGLIANIPTLIETVPEIVTNIAGCINDNAPKLLETAVTLIGQLALGLIQAIPTLVANIPQIITAIASVFEAFNWVSLGKNIMTMLKNGITGMVSSLKSAGTDCLNSIYDAIKSLPTKLSSLGKSGISGLASGIRGMLSSAASAATAILNGCVSAITSLPSKLLSIGKNAITQMKSVFKQSEWVNIGKNVINGIISGITSMVGKLYSSIKSALSGLVSKAKSALGISSPSKVFASEIGEWIPPGIGEGVEDAMPDLNTDMQNEMQAMTEKMKGTVEVETAKIQVEHSAASTYQAQKEAGTAFASGDTTVEVNGTIQTNVNLEGKTVATALTPYIDKELKKRETKKARGG